MSETPAPRSAGILLALSLITGGIVGSINGQPSLGTVIGLAVGVAAVTVIWLVDRRG